MSEARDSIQGCAVSEGTSSVSSVLSVDRRTWDDECDKNGHRRGTSSTSGRCSRHGMAAGCATSDDSSVRMLLVDPVSSSSSSNESHSSLSRSDSLSTANNLTRGSANGTRAAAATALTSSTCDPQRQTFNYLQHKQRSS